MKYIIILIIYSINLFAEQYYIDVKDYTKDLIEITIEDSTTNNKFILEKPKSKEDMIYITKYVIKKYKQGKKK